MSPAAKPASGTSRARADEAMSSSRIDLQGLQVFEAVMRERNVTRAALSLSLSQPAVSHAITRLRLLFRDPLFLRAAGGVRPTRRAEELWLEIREPLAALRRVIVPAEFEPATAKLSVSLAVNDMLIQEHLTPWCAQLLRIAPGLRLALVTRSFGDTETRLVEGTLERHRRLPTRPSSKEPSARGTTSVGSSSRPRTAQWRSAAPRRSTSLRRVSPGWCSNPSRGI